MATITEGQQYALTNQFSNSKGQSMVFVKLTDSALKAIEDYAAAVSKGNNSSSLKPSIQFRPNNSQGVITIPTKVNSPEGDKHSYNFSVKDIQNDGILECIQQNHNTSMESLGKILFRMQIHANDDSYQNTRVKMAVAAEQELKKYNTKVIQQDDPNVGRKVKVKSTTSRAPFSSSKPFASSLNNGTANPSSSSMYKTQPTSISSLSSMPRFNKFSPAPAATNSGTLSKPTNFFQGTSNNVVSEALKKTIRENLIHYLAVKPLKLGDLLAKLQDKVKETVDKNTVIGVLNSISTYKDGTYHLNDSFWDEVQTDWLHYSKEERDSVQRRNPLLVNLSETQHGVANLNLKGNLSNSTSTGIGSNGNSISPLSDSSAHSQSSPNSVGTSPNLKNSPFSKTALKRNEPLYPNNSLKRFKNDSRFVAHAPNGKSYPNSSAKTSANAVLNHSSPLDKLNISDHESPEGRNSFQSNSNCYKTNHFPLLHESSNLQLQNKKGDTSIDRETCHSRVNSYQRISGNGSGSINSSPNSSPDSGISHVGNIPSSDSSINDPDEYLSKYTKILNNDQLLQYKNDFSTEYPEYRRLFEYVDSVSREFDELHELILSKEEDSDEWNELIQRTMEKYEEVKHKSRYNKAQKRLNYLHYKLTHIKNLISDYNRNHEKDLSPLARFGAQLKS